MRDALSYRGPDDAGIAADDDFAFGHRRLSIIDLSAAGRQPMANEDSTIHLVANGEIYNFAPLRDELIAGNHTFRSGSDSEVLIHGYEQWGLAGLLSRIRGMYAFALYDARMRQLHLARDPLGKKPLYFSHSGGLVAFASSTRALLHGLKTRPEVDLTAVYDLLWHMYIPAPRTIFRGVEKLLPGCSVTFDENGNRRTARHWTPNFSVTDDSGDVETWTRRIEDRLRAAVRRRFIADVPVGVLLSGGVDSSLVAAIGSEATAGVRTFSVATDDPALDESGFARMVAAARGTRHVELRVRNDVGRHLPRLIAAMGDPLADASALNLFAICQTAREHVKVVLTGDGGDEAFGGYSHYAAYYFAGKLRRVLPSWMLSPVSGTGSILRRGPSVIRRAGTLLTLTGRPVSDTFPELGRSLSRDLAETLFTEDFAATIAGHDPRNSYRAALEESDCQLPVDSVMQAQMRTLLPDDYLAKVDFASMAVPIEARCPLLDVDVVNEAMTIPADIRFLNGEPKGLLRHIARRHVPLAAVNRPKKGFVAPVGRWLRREWRPIVDDLVLGVHVERRGWFRRSGLRALVDRQRTQGDNAYVVWALMVLELWMRISEGTVSPEAEL